MTETTSRTSLTAANRLRPMSQRVDEVASAAAVTGIWLLFPLAIGGFTFLLLGLIILAISSDPDPGIPFFAWLILTLALQALYWVWIAHVSGRNPINGLWALIPVVALIPTFPLARAVVLVRDPAFKASDDFDSPHSHTESST